MSEHEETRMATLKSKFKDFFGVSAEENALAFSNFVLSKTLNELSGEISNLQDKIDEHTQALLDTGGND